MNEGLTPIINPNILSYLESCKRQGASARYIGSLVADFHRNLLKGGIYLYPSTSNAASGKIRLIYEANALAFIAEQVGGMASDGNKRILDIQPESLHQRTPFFIGSTSMVKKLEESLKGT
jgi:fructose-1,6-bisphosphatase I